MKHILTLTLVMLLVLLADIRTTQWLAGWNGAVAK